MELERKNQNRGSDKDTCVRPVAPVTTGGGETRKVVLRRERAKTNRSK